MIDVMPRPRPPYLHRTITRHGAIAWYVQRDGGKRARIRGEYGSPEFTAAYDAAIRGEPLAAKPGPVASSLAWLVARYRDSAAWAKLSTATKRQRENIFSHVLKTGDSAPYAGITRKTISAAMDRRKDTPFAAANFLLTMRGLFAWAVDAEIVPTNPTDKINSGRPRTEGFRVWTEDEIDAFEARWPIGTRERLALAILLYTGLRRGDAASLGRQHIRNGEIKLRAKKNGMAVTIPLLPELARVIAATETGDLTFIARERGGQPMTKEGFGNWFRKACNAAGVRGSAHGLRKAGATRAANNGATVAQLEAIFGWSGGRMASLYTRTADRTKLAKEAMAKLER